MSGEYHLFPEETSDEVWCAFDRFQHQRKCYVLHSRRDFYNILSDLKSDGGNFVVMARDDEDRGSQIVSMAWGVVSDGLLLVKDVMGEDSDSRAAALRQLRCLYTDTPVLLLGHPDDSMGGRLMPRGMGASGQCGESVVSHRCCRSWIFMQHTGERQAAAGL